MGRLARRAAAALLTATAGLLALGSPAWAIQTTTWGIQPASTSGGPRPSLSYPSNGQTVHDAVIVYNRTGDRQVITLSVLDAVRTHGTYRYSAERKGLAAGVSLAAERITLPPHEQARVPVTVRLPRHSKVTTLAAIAAKGAPVKEGALLVEQQLVILVKATPSTASPVLPGLGLWGPAAGILLAAVAGFALVEARRRRREIRNPVQAQVRPTPAARSEAPAGVR